MISAGFFAFLIYSSVYRSFAMDSKRAEPFYQLRPFKDNMDPINLLEFILFHDRQGRSLCPSPRKVRG